MKLKNICMFAAAMLLLAYTTASGAEKAKLGPCVRQCVQAYNPSLADSGADEFMAVDFRAKECVQLCKEDLYQGECASHEDECCHPDYLNSDPDCWSEPPPDLLSRQEPVMSCLLTRVRPARQLLKELIRTGTVCVTIFSDISS